MGLRGVFDPFLPLKTDPKWGQNRGRLISADLGL